MANYSEAEVVEKLNRHTDIQISGKTISILKEPKGIIGNGTKGKLDFLINYNGYVLNYVEKFSK